MTLFSNALTLFLWPGDRFCAILGASPHEDSGMLRGFINSIVWGLAAALIIWIVL